MKVGRKLSLRPFLHQALHIEGGGGWELWDLMLFIIIIYYSFSKKKQKQQNKYINCLCVLLP